MLAKVYACKSKSIHKQHKMECASLQACKPARGDETASLMGWEKAHHECCSRDSHMPRMWAELIQGNE